jgi:NAD(P)-dependent dehydrogenase (short-subunit alcohol dehydrogenase family)
MTITKPSILIIGASRGIGLGLVGEYLSRGWNVIATERHPSSTSTLGQLAQNSAGSLRIEAIDINLPEQIVALFKRLQEEEFDALFVNAGVIDRSQSIAQISTEAFNHLMLTNVLSPLRTIEALANLVKPQGTISVMSSLMGSISENTTGGAEAYRASKAALNSLLRSYEVRVNNQQTLLALHPGWVKTEMGGPDAPVEIEQSVKGLADTIEQRSGKSGLVFVDFQNQQIAW